MKKKILISYLFISSLLFSYLVPNIGYAKDFSTLEQTVKSSAKKYPQLALYYQNLVTGQTYSYQPTKVFSAASTIKLPLVLYVYELASQNKINLNEKLTYKSHHYYGGSGVIQKDKVGTKYTIKDLVKKSVVYSDNIAFIMLREKVGKANFIKYAKSIGGTVVYPNGSNQTTAQDLSKYLKHLWDFSKKNPALGNELIDLLKNTVYKETVAKSVDPKNVAHKVGYIPMNLVYNDAAIVFDDQPYILVVMTKGIPVGQDVKFISNLAEVAQKDHDASAANHFVTLLDQAEKSKVQLMREISIDYEADVEVRPYGIFNQLKDQYTKAQNAYKQLDESDQEKYSERMQNIDLWIKRAIVYIDAISAGEKLEDLQLSMEGYLNKGEIDKAADSYHHLSALIRRQAVYLYRPYGKSTREAIMNRYKNPAEASVQKSIYLISAYEEIKKLSENIQAKNLEEIEKNKKRIEAWLPLIEQDPLREMLKRNYESVLNMTTEQAV